jgi:hypothetical protein
MADSFEKVIETRIQVCIASERDDEVRTVDHLLEIAAQRHKPSLASPAQSMLSANIALNSLLCGRVETCRQDLRCVWRSLWPDRASSLHVLRVHLEDSEDLIDQLLVTTLNCGARIEQVRGAAAEKLRNVGGIGAVLRY